MEIAKTAQLRQDGAGFIVPSQTSKRKYFVAEENGAWSCGCADYHYRHVVCKHINAVKYWEEMKKEILTYDGAPSPNEAEDSEDEPALACPYCEGSDVVKNGSRKNALTVKQRYLCRACKKTFLTDAFKKFKGDGRAITLVMDLYFKGISLRKIQDHLKQFYGMDVHFDTIRRWIGRYMGIINAYVKTQKPQKLGKKWHTDEMMVKSDGRYLYLWNCMDAETRFMLANNVSKERRIKDATDIFAMAKETAGSMKPERMITDKLPSYHKAFNKIFYSNHRTSKHISIVQHRHEIDNNMVERLNSTVRERDKVLRGLKGRENTRRFFESYKTYYNFVRPHQALEGRTPAEQAGIELPKAQNRWMGLIEKARSQPHPTA